MLEAAEPPALAIDGFLHHAIDRYLLADVRELRKIRVPPGESGEGSYLIVFAILVACELLGRLAGKKQQEGVAHFWTTYMPPIYESLGDFARTLLRNYVGHLYSMPPGLVVLRGDPEAHLHRDQEGHVFIDCLELADDFERSYPAARAAILSDEATSARQFRQIIEVAEKQRAAFAVEIASLPLFVRKPFVPRSKYGTTYSGAGFPGASDSPMPQPEEEPGPGTASGFRYRAE